ncbi:hypothetical protein TNCV_3888551 [Trichonephila clavipes]|nr:hypothetical protein TNCV_3888551 [Trichonephila clavipes]
MKPRHNILTYPDLREFGVMLFLNLNDSSLLVFISSFITETQVEPVPDPDEIDMIEQERDIEEPESLNPVQSEARMTVGNLTEGFSLIEKGLQILENTYFNKTRKKKLLAKTSLIRHTTS